MKFPVPLVFPHDLSLSQPQFPSGYDAEAKIFILQNSVAQNIIYALLGIRKAG